MKKAGLIVIILSLLLVGGCDSVRRAAGRPTSKDIEIKRAQIAAAEARMDSLKLREQALKDSLDAADALREEKVSLKSVGEMGELYSDSLEYRYYIVVGAFKSPENAQNMMKRASDAGYIPTKIAFKNGLIAVGVAPVNSLYEARYSLNAVLREEFCPLDVWILVNK